MELTCSCGMCRDWEKGRVRAGRDDRRRPMAVWLGRPMSLKRGKRKAIVAEGFRNPHRVYAGLTRWDGIPIPDKATEYPRPAYPSRHGALPLFCVGSSEQSCFCVGRQAAAPNYSGHTCATGCKRSHLALQRKRRVSRDAVIA